MMLLRTKRSSSAKVAAGSLGSALRSPSCLLASVDHVLEPLLVAPGERAQAAAEVVVQHQRPAAEQLLGEELREHAVARRSAPSPDAEQIVGVAVQDERGGRARRSTAPRAARPRREATSGQLSRGDVAMAVASGSGVMAQHLAQVGARESPAAPRAGRPGRSGAAAR